MIVGDIKIRGGSVKQRSITLTNQVGTDVDQVNTWGASAPIFRVPLSAAIPVYVSPSGSDASVGFTVPGAPLLTLKRAIFESQSRSGLVIVERHTTVGNIIFRENINTFGEIGTYQQITVVTGEEAIIEFENTLASGFEDEEAGVDFTTAGLPTDVAESFYTYRQTTVDYLIVGRNVNDLYYSTNGLAFTAYGYVNGATTTYYQPSTEFLGDIFISAFSSNVLVGGHLVRISGTTEVLTQGSIANTAPISVLTHNGFIYYSSSNTAGTLWKVYKSIDGTTWSEISTPTDYQGKLISYKGILYYLTLNNGVYILNADDTFTFHNAYPTGKVLGAGPEANTRNAHVAGNYVVIQFADNYTGFFTVERTTDLRSFEPILLDLFTSPSSDLPVIVKLPIIDTLLVKAGIAGFSGYWYSKDAVTWNRITSSQTLTTPLRATFAFGFVYSQGIASGSIVRHSSMVQIGSDITYYLDGLKFDGRDKAIECYYYCKQSATNLPQYVGFCNFHNQQGYQFLLDRVNVATMLFQDSISSYSQGCIKHTIRTGYDMDIFIISRSIFYRLTEDALQSENAIDSPSTGMLRNTCFMIRSFLRILAGYTGINQCIGNIFWEMTGADIYNLSVGLITFQTNITSRASIGIFSVPENLPFIYPNVTANPLFVSEDDNDFRLQTSYQTAPNGQYYIFDSIAKGRLFGPGDLGCYNIIYTNNDIEFSYELLTKYNPRSIEFSYPLKRVSIQEDINGDLHKTFLDTRLKMTMNWDDDSIQDFNHFYQIFKVIRENKPMEVYFNYPYNQVSGACRFNSNITTGLFTIDDSLNTFAIDRYRGFWAEVIHLGTTYHYFINECLGERLTLLDLRENNLSVTNSTTTYKIRYILMTSVNEDMKGTQKAFSGFQLDSQGRYVSFQSYTVELEAYHKRRLI